MNKITFKDRNDLIKNLDTIVIKKSDVNKGNENLVKSLQDSLKRYSRGDKEAMKKIIKLRRKMLNAASEVYIELEEDALFTKTVAELEILDLIEE